MTKNQKITYFILLKMDFGNDSEFEVSKFLEEDNDKNHLFLKIF